MSEINSLFFTELKSKLLESLRGKCEQDSSYSKVWNHVQMRGPFHSNGSVPSSSTHGSSFSQDELQQWKKFSIDDGYLLHKGRVCVPLDLDIRRQILHECHDSPSAGHADIWKTYALVRKHFYWPGLHKDVTDYVLQCQKCQVNKAERLKAGGLLHPL